MDNLDFSFDTPAPVKPASPAPARKAPPPPKPQPPASPKPQPQPRSPEPQKKLIGPVAPQSIEAEVCVLGSCILDPTSLDVCLRLADESDFFRPAHKLIWTAIKTLGQRAEPLDLVTIREEMICQGTLDSIGGIEYLMQIVEGVPRTSNTEYYLRIAQDKALLRESIRIGHAMAREAFLIDTDPQSLLRNTELSIENALNRVRCGAEGSMDARDAVAAVLRHVENPAASKVTFTGIEPLDLVSGGLARGDYAILAGVTGGGKTSLALHILGNICRAGGKVLFVSKEMQAPQLAQRILSAESRVPLSLIRSGDSSHYDLNAPIAEAAASVGTWRFRVNRAATTVRDVVVAAKAFGHECGEPDLVIVDYLTKLRGPGRDRYERFSQISSDLKQACLNELPCPMLVLAQFGRDVGKEDRKPTRYDLKESGEIENDADFIWLIHSPAPCPGDTMHNLWVRQDKARQGPSNTWPDDNESRGTVWMEWDKQSCFMRAKKFV